MIMETQHTKTYRIQKAILRGKFVAVRAFIKKEEKLQINYLMMNLKELEKQEETKPKVSRRKEVIKIRAEIKLKRRKYKRSMK